MSSDEESDNIDVLEYMKDKQNLTTAELSVFLFYIVKQLIKIENIKNNNIDDYFDSVKNLQDVFNTKSLDELQNLYIEHTSIINNYHKNDKCLNVERKLLHNTINIAMSQFNSNVSIQNVLTILKNQEDNIMIRCEFKNLCVSCKGTSIYNTKHDIDSHCFNCEYCDELRSVKEKYEKKRVKKMLIKQLDEIYNKKNPGTIVKNKVTLKNEKVNINNTYIQINIHQNIFNQNYIKSKDRFFEVFIRDKDNNLQNLKHVFIYFMCRSKAIDLFPNEKYNLVTSHPLSAGLYTIEDNVLHGILRYKHTNSSRMTLKKLENITHNDKINIVAHQLNYYNNVKDNHSAEQLTSIINTITLTNSYGSVIEDFYKSD